MSNYSKLSEEEKEKRREACRRWAAKNDRSEYYSRYAKENKEKVNAKNRKLRENNLERYKDYHKKNYEKNKTNWTLKTKEYVMLKAAKTRAKTKGLEYNITIEDVVIPEFCPVFPLIKLRIDNTKAEFDSPTLDRIDATKGYIKGNVAVISHLANTIKSVGNAEQHEQIAKWLRSFD